MIHRFAVRSFAATAAVVLVAGSFASSVASASPSEPESNGPKVHVTSVSMEQSADGQQLAFDTVKVDPDEVTATVEELNARPEVLVAAPRQRVRAMNDPHRSAQWGWGKLRTERLPAWANGAGTTVAVIDSGVDANHPDLLPRLADGRERVVSDPFYDQLWGRNSRIDVNGHGTHVAGVIAAAKDNWIGITGIAPEAQILSYRALDAEGGGWDDEIAMAISWAHDAGADVINLSLGSTERSPIIEQVIRSVTTPRVDEPASVVVAASGNTYAEHWMWPAAMDEVIAVGATDSADNPAPYSTRGSWIDVAAPGSSILSTQWNTYVAQSGTSMAAPHVAAAAAVLLQIDPRRTPVDIRWILQDSARDVGSRGFDVATGAGRVDLATAVDPWHSPKMPPPVIAPTGTVVGLEVRGRQIVTWGWGGDVDGTPVARLWVGRPGFSTEADVWALNGGFGTQVTVPGSGTYTACVSLLDTPTFAPTTLECREVVVK